MRAKKEPFINSDLISEVILLVFINVVTIYFILQY